MVATLGSAGDLYPLLAVARALAERGEPVVFLGQEGHRAEVQAQGLHFEAIVSAEAEQRTAQHPLLWHPVAGLGVLWRHLCLPAIDPTLAVLRRLAAASDAPLPVLASPLVLGARLARELLPLRLSTALPAPAALRSCADPLFLGPWQVPPWLPRPLRRLLWAALDRWKLQPLAAPRLNRWRADHGLPPLPGPVFERWLHSPDQVIGLFPPQFAADPGDWPVPVQLTGFPLYESQRQPQPDAALDRWIGRSPQPVLVFFDGSAAAPTEPGRAELLQRLQHSGRRCLVLGGHGSAPPGLSNRLPARVSADTPTLRHQPWVDLSALLPRVALLVHHGGIGTTAQALAAGVPQLILPRAYDQFDNAERVARLGAGRWLPPRQRQPQQLMQAINALLQAPPCPPPPGWQHSRPGAANAAVQAVCALWQNSLSAPPPQATR